MLYYTLTSEAEIYCTNLSFYMGDGNFDKYIGNSGIKNEDAERSIHTKMQEMIAKYKRVFYSIAEKVNPTDVAKAVYLTSYYHAHNKSS